jgi:hypothetical protein
MELMIMLDRLDALSKDWNVTIERGRGGTEWVLILTDRDERTLYYLGHDLAKLVASAWAGERPTGTHAWDVVHSTVKR